MTFRRALALLCFAVLALAGCSEEPDIALSPEAEAGREITRSSGCSSCHGKNGQGVTAPPWQGLYLKRVPIEGGDTVLADADYLFQSITDPQAVLRRDWTIKMPTNSLTDAQVESVIAYIKELQ